VANTRNDFQHKLSRRLVDENQAIALETLKVKNMLKSMDRDINAALNIKQQGILKLKAEGLSVSANGGLRKTGETPAVA